MFVLLSTHPKKGKGTIVHNREREREGERERERKSKEIYLVGAGKGI